MDEALDMEVGTVIEWLHALGYRAERRQDDAIVYTAAEGYKFGIRIYEDSLQYAAHFETADTTATLESCHDYTAKYRWAKAYFIDFEDDSRSLIIEMDAWMNFLAEDGRYVFQAMTERFIALILKSREIFA
ncbi:YbjN domain-containing protein [Tanticharoenia sakaeratensis]|uniref:YbjN domain-containing protein n=1 Tax=Tanticharoenia sakaeratensis NBRC 103193 TaxID=1231623 RepID=A0A0D6MJV6_9PROT|nr:YbjN domain-containing protein [Tanticharoenia sakaeratensis]GAN53568.1 hypothetical protein Tasa_010_115 [Tanticharoenia sakaeratensis NBRC 103193]GBQ17531.1 hypothetical protein AA103193_0372 [Tanticharoenia sakaeratensis NBRC 103193]